MTLLEALAVASSVLAGLVGGVFFAFSVFVMRALAQLAPEAGVSAMQRVNVTVITPAFLGPFLGTAPLLGFSAYLCSNAGKEHAAAWLAVSFLVYALGSVGVTLLFNVPRNNKLANLDAGSESAARYWPVYVREWLFWNHVRTAACVVAATLAAVAVSAARSTAAVAA